MNKIKTFYLAGIIIVLFSILLVNSVSASDLGTAQLYGRCTLNASLINQDPYPAVPGEYIDVVFQVSGVDNPECNGAWFEFIPEFPFSLDKNDGTMILNGATYTSDSKNAWMIPYTLGVDEDAFNGNTTIKVHYGPGTEISNSYYDAQFKIMVQDSRTNFDAVVQEVSGTDVSIALANTGKYTANSVIVRIPEQSGFKVAGTDGQMVGNLDSGDYTLVSFSISPKLTQTERQNISKTNGATNVAVQPLSSKLNIDVYYTDNIGERRIVNMELPLTMVGNFTTGTGGVMSFASRTNSTTTTSSGSNLYYWAIAVAALLVLWVVYSRYKKHVARHNIRGSSGSTPTWLRKAKDKENRK